ncbi:MAG: hypothetical protein AAFX93_19330 [Verrucomicrobiota bacterium]
MFKQAVTALSIVLTFSGLAKAQSESCVGALIQDARVLDLSEIESLSRAELLYRSKGRDTNWAASVTVPIKGVPVSGNADSAESTRERFFSQSDLDWNSNRLLSLATQTLTEKAVAAHRNCIDGQHRSGPRILVHDATPTEATVTIIWQSPPGGRKVAHNAKFDITGGSFRRPFPTTWQDGASDSVIVKRSANSDIRIVATIGLESDNEFISRIPEIPPGTAIAPPPQCRIAAIPVRGRNCGATFEYAGAIDAQAHGGHCINFNGCDFYTQEVRSGQCTKGVYAGPLDPAAHGGTCNVLSEPSHKLVSAPSNAPCPPGTTHIGPIDQRVHGGVCLTLQPR